MYAGIFLFILPWTACFRSLTCCTPACFASESSLLRFAGLVLLASSLRVATSFLAFGFRGRFSFARTFPSGLPFGGRLILSPAEVQRAGIVPADHVAGELDEDPNVLVPPKRREKRRIE